MNKFISPFIILLIICCCLYSCKYGSYKDKSKISLIFDTDMQSDVDDVGALAMLHSLEYKKEIEILGVMVSSKNPSSILCVDRINTYFNRKYIPLGQLKKNGVFRESQYAKKVAEKFPGTLNSETDAVDALIAYRKILAAQPDSSVTIITVGYLTNIRNLLLSIPDSLCDLSGKELIEKKVRTWVCMGGMFPSGREANIRWDTEASIEAIKNWPSAIIFSGWEIGNFDTGENILKLSKNNPIRYAYELFGHIPHKSWDQVATLYATQGNLNRPYSSFWKLSEPGEIVIDEKDGSNIWINNPNGKHQYLIQLESNYTISKAINELMMHDPN